MNVLLATQKPFSTDALKAIRRVIEKAGHTLHTLEKYKTEAELIKAVRDTDALIVRSDQVTAKVLATAKQLKIVVRAGAGYDNLDLAACTRHGVVAMNTPGQNSNAVAELAIGLMIHSARNFLQPGTGSELRGRRLGLQAYGNVGRLVAHHAKGLGMEVHAFDPFVSLDTMQQDSITPVEQLEQLYETCDYVSLHIPALPDTIGSIGYDLMSLMPTGGTLLNTARGEVIDEIGLMRVLTVRTDLKYITDIMPANYTELVERFPGRVYATPKKMGAETAEANLNAGVAAASQVVNFLATGDTTFQLNK